MPEICHFYGIAITMYLPDHNPPHFHVRYNEYRATIDIQTGRVTGQMPRCALHLTFNDGCERIFDCLPLIERYKLFAPLRDKEVFNHFDLDGWTVCWLNGTIDIAPEHLYEMSEVA